MSIYVYICICIIEVLSSIIHSYYGHYGPQGSIVTIAVYGYAIYYRPDPPEGVGRGPMGTPRGPSRAPWP